jgi:hypothetical protein
LIDNLHELTLNPPDLEAGSWLEGGRYYIMMRKLQSILLLAKKGFVAKEGISSYCSIGMWKISMIWYVATSNEADGIGSQ